ncbi:YibE/F family protein [Candidatus Kaiserbacteria bacterium]|nr:YibE/F family protein [Candidatus Kaiserbacteria bacterium]MCB9812485.1 YibE/F family protein [Candidatus Nomurabacteria bacterium]
MWRASFSKLAVLLLISGPSFGLAQTVHQEVQERLSAEVLEVVKEYDRTITGTNATATVQEVRATLLEGDRAGEVVRFESELVRLESGDHIFVDHRVLISGEEYFSYADFERRPVLALLAALFVLLLLCLSGWQGVRALLSLGASVICIFFLLVPALLAGYDPALASMVIAGGILALVLFGTHGFTARTTIAFVGTFSAVVVTCLIAWLSTNAMRLSGFGSDASVYLNFATNGTLDLSGLLLGSIIIGILGVLDDVSITQASVTEQLKHANPSFQFTDLYRRAITVGRDHIGSLVNTLALAYVGVSLPLILLYVHADSALFLSLNQEVIAAEVVRILVGSIGLMLAVPATTAAAAWYFSRHTVDEEPEASPCAHGHHHH